MSANNKQIISKNIKGVFFDLYGTLLIYGDMAAAWSDWFLSVYGSFQRYDLSISREAFSLKCDGFFEKPEPPLEDDGLVMITSKDAGEAKRAEDWIKDLTREVEVGEIFQGKVVRIMNFGAFVELLPGKDGLVHISELAPNRVEKVEDVVNLGDVIAVKVKEIDDQGRISLTHKGV